MAYETTRAGQVEDYLIAQLQARPGLAGVQVEVGPLGDETDAVEYIQTTGEPAPLSSSQAWGSIGNYKKVETAQLRGEIFVEKPGAGAQVLREARDRALELLAEVEEMLREQMAVRQPNRKFDGLVTEAKLIDWEERRGASPGNRHSLIVWTIEYTAELKRT